MRKTAKEDMWKFWIETTSGEELSRGTKLCKSPSRTSKWKNMNRELDSMPNIKSIHYKLVKNGIK